MLRIFIFFYAGVRKQEREKRKRRKHYRSRDFMLLPTNTYIEEERNSERMKIRRLRFVEFRWTDARWTDPRTFDEEETRFVAENSGKKRHRKVNSLGSPGTTEAGEKLWRLRRRNSVDCCGFMYAACIRARAQRDLSALGRVSVGQVEWIVNVSGRTSPRWRPPPGASLFTPHGSPRGKSSMARVEHSNPRIH